MNLQDIFLNQVLIAGGIAWALAQGLKLPIEYFRSRRWNWSLLFSVGGMPSSHSAWVASLAHACGLYAGFDSAVFALSVGVAAVVIYDATGIRRQAGKHAEVINTMIEELAAGHPLKQEQLREVLGHTPYEALAGMILGIVVAQIEWLLWH